MKKIRLATAAVVMAACSFATAASSPEAPLAKARGGTSMAEVSRLTQSSAERHETQPLPDPRVRSWSTGMPAPRVPSMRTVAAAGANLFGSIPGDESFVSITVGDNISVTSLGKFSNVLNPNGGAVFIGDDKYLANEYDENPYLTANYITIFKFDGKNISKSSSTTFMDEEAWSATDLAFDPTTKTVYGYFTLNDGSASFFGKLNDKYVPVKIFAGIKLVALACDDKGHLYGIKSDGTLVHVDKANGAYANIEKTMVTPGTSGSAAFGADGKLYWTNWSASDGCRLYHVDTLSGRAALVGAIPNGKQIVGLCSYSNKVPAVPSAPTDAELVLDGDALSGKIRFTVPATLADGTNGEGNVSWTVAIGGVTIQSGQAAYGAVVEAPVSVTEAGEYTFLVVLSNENGSAPNTPVTGWIGPDNRSVLTPPFNYTFETADKLNDFTILDVNNDGKKWAFYNGRVRIIYNSVKAMDDWLISPPVMLEAGRLYEFTSLFSCYSDSEERIEVMLGNSPTVEAMTMQVIPKSTLQTEYNKPDTFTGKIKVDVSGKYFIGVHGCSDEDKNTLFLHSFAISEGMSAAAPAAPTALTVTPGADCALEASVSCKAPEADINGNPVYALTKLEILRDGNVIHTESELTPGQVITYTDRGENITHGLHTYSARAYNDAGVGDAAQTEVYIGVRIPAKPASAMFRQTSPGQVEVKWDKVTVDENGNTIPENFVRYALIIVANGQSTIVKEDLTATSYSYKLCEPDSPQDLYYYGVRAVTDAGFSEAALTDMLPVGKSYTVPFHESFADADVSYVWGTKRVSGVTTAWKIYTSQASLPAQDGDNGFAAMSGSSSGDEGILSSGNIIVEGKSPELTFWYFNLGQDCQNTIDLMIDAGDGVLKSVLSKVLSGPQGWAKAKFSLTPYLGKTIRIAFDGKIVTHSNISIDNISIREALEHNLSATSFSVPAEVMPDTDYEIALTVVNNGSQKAEGWKAELMLDGEVSATIDGPSITSDSSVTLKFPVRHNVTSPASLRYSARVVYDKDDDMTDNATEEYESVMRLNNWPAPSQLTASAEGEDVRLVWTEPLPGDNIPVTEGFEDWAHLSKTACNGWTMLNLDSGLAGGFKNTPLSGIDNQAVGFFAVDCTVDPLSGNSTFASKSGNKYMASMYSYDGSTGNAVANDDWLITPELDGSSQKISFYAKSYSTDYLETFQVLYSTTDTKPESFNMIKEVRNVPGTWTLYEYTVPSGAKYFAIRCVSDDAFFFMVDDISYIPLGGVRLELKGYNVYRDGVRVTDSPVAELAYVDRGVSATDHIYHVSAVYDRGESVPAKADYKRGSSVDVIGVDSFSVSVAPGTIVIEGVENLPVSVILPDGKTIWATTASSSVVRVGTAPGLYLVRVGRTVRKVIVP